MRAALPIARPATAEFQNTTPPLPRANAPPGTLLTTGYVNGKHCVVWLQITTCHSSEFFLLALQFGWVRMPQGFGPIGKLPTEDHDPI